MTRITAYIDSKGEIFSTPDAAALSDLSRVFGTSDNNIATARTVLANRTRIEEIFKELDSDSAPEPAFMDPDEPKKNTLELGADSEIKAGNGVASAGTEPDEII